MMKNKAEEQLDLLEKRVKALEEQVLGKARKSDAQSGASITDMLLETQVMISSALSCREAVTKMLERLTTINAYLDPTNGDDTVDAQAKRQYLIEMYPQVIKDLQQLDIFQRLSPVLDSTSIARVVELSDKLNSAVTTNLTTYEQARTVTNNVLKALRDYNEINTSLQMVFYELDVAIAELEAHAKPVKPVEE